MKQKKTVGAEQSVKFRILRDIAKVPSFFLYRTIAWYIMGIMLLIASFAWELLDEKPVRAFLTLSVILFLLFIWKGTELLLLGMQKKYFTRTMVCKTLRVNGFLEQLKNYINPISETPFRLSNQAVFEAEDGTQVTFRFDRIRMFHEGGVYLFYFRIPFDEGSEMSAEMLQILKIDHSILPNIKI